VEIWVSIQALDLSTGNEKPHRWDEAFLPRLKFKE
jgi:hypothetical protein